MTCAGTGRILGLHHGSCAVTGTVVIRTTPIYLWKGHLRDFFLLWMAVSRGSILVLWIFAQLHASAVCFLHLTSCHTYNDVMVSEKELPRSLVSPKASEL